MITRIRIHGFKSLLNTDLHLGPFTCIAGVNAIGKSNLFDALMFLSRLSDNTIVEAARSVRSEHKKHSDIKDIFYKSGSQYLPKMTFEVDMLVSKIAEDDLGQRAEASITSLRYILELRLNESSSNRELIEITKEELLPITQNDFKEQTYFDYDNAWMKTVLSGRRLARNPFISTQGSRIKLHQDGNKKGRTTEFIAEKMPRTLLSTATAESPTAFMVRREMRNWIMLQLEPSALREPNSIYEVKNAEMTAFGNNLPATLYRLHLEKKDADVYQQLTNQMRELVPSIDKIMVDSDEKRNLLTLQVRFKDGLILPAHSLSDGTLRFLGLSILREDNKGNSLICLEEPENGIHPKKVKEIIGLLEEMATDTGYPVNDANPLRQVIINSHSPLVVREVPEDSLYLATDTEQYDDSFEKKVRYTRFAALEGTWRVEKKLCRSIPLGDIIDYLGEADSYTTADGPEFDYLNQTTTAKTAHKRTVKENYYHQLEIFHQ